MLKPLNRDYHPIFQKTISVPYHFTVRFSKRTKRKSVYGEIFAIDLPVFAGLFKINVKQISTSCAVPSKYYKNISDKVDNYVTTNLPAGFSFLWFHPAGLKTIFFWAPTFKWGLVLAGLGDLIARDPAVTSLNQAGVLTITALIWCRYSMVIIPVNWNLFMVNAFIAVSQSITYIRAAMYTKNDLLCNM